MNRGRGSMKRSSRLQRRRLWSFYIQFLGILSVSFLLMPFGNLMREKSPILLYLSGALLWAGMIGTAWASVQINLSRRKSSYFAKMQPHLRRFGPVHFFQNVYAGVADAVMFLSLIALILTKVLWDNQIAQFISLSFLVFSFGMHCMLNGVNYIYITHQAGYQSQS